MSEAKRCSKMCLELIDCNCMQNGTVVIPEVLQPYMDNQKVLSKLSSPINVTYSSLKKERTNEKGLMFICCAAD